MVARVSEYVHVMRRVHKRLKIRASGSSKMFRADRIGECRQFIGTGGPEFRFESEGVARAVFPELGILLGSAAGDGIDRSCPFTKLRQAMRGWRQIGLGLMDGKMP